MLRLMAFLVVFSVLTAGPTYAQKRDKYKRVNLGLTKEFVESIYDMSRTEWRSKVLQWRRQGLAIDMSQYDDTMKPFKKIQNIIYLTKQSDYAGVGSVTSWIGPTYVDENEITDIQFNWNFSLPYDGLTVRDLDLICRSSMLKNKEELAPDFDGLFECHHPTKDAPTYWFQIFLFKNY